MYSQLRYWMGDVSSKYQPWRHDVHLSLTGNVNFDHLVIENTCKFTEMLQLRNSTTNTHMPLTQGHLQLTFYPTCFIACSIYIIFFLTFMVSFINHGALNTSVCISQVYSVYIVHNHSIVISTNEFKFDTIFYLIYYLSFHFLR